MALVQHEIGTQGLIINCFPSGEQDKILRVVTDTFGKISVLAKSSRGNTSKRSPRPDLFDYGTFHLSPPKGSSDLFRLQGSSSLRNHTPLVQSFEKMVVGSFLCELVDLITTSENVEDRNILGLMLEHLKTLSKSDDPKITLRIIYFAALELLEATGFPLQDPPDRASSKNLKRVMHHVETLSNRSLRTRSSMDLLVQRFAKSVN